MQSTETTRSDGPEAGGDPTLPASHLLDEALALTRELRETLHDQLRLVSYEAQRAAHSLAVIVAAAVGIGVLLASAWLGLMTAGALAVIRLGLAPDIAALIVVALNLIGTWVLYRMIRGKSCDMGFPATVRILRPTQARSRDQEAA